jgi:hypothetical protein
VEHVSGGVVRFGRRWWFMRTTPIFVCIAAIGHTFSRGQVNTLMLMLICGLIAGLMTSRSFLAGLSLAGAICLKIIPAFLVLVPLWRRDGRCLVAVAVGLVVGLGAIPLAVLGPTRTVESYRVLGEAVLGPAFGLGGDRSRGEELLDVSASDSQSFRTMIQASLYPDRDTRPRDATGGVKWASNALGLLLMLVTLAACRGARRTETGLSLLFFAGALMLVMLLLSPVSHLHYFVLEVPLVMALLARDWAKKPALTGSLLRPGRADSPLSIGTLAILTIILLGNLLPQLPVFLVLRDRGLAGITALLLWLVACWALWRTEPPRTGVQTAPLPLAA